MITDMIEILLWDVCEVENMYDKNFLLRLVLQISHFLETVYDEEHVC